MNEAQIAKWKQIDRKREIQVARYTSRAARAVSQMVAPFMRAMETADQPSSLYLLVNMPQDLRPMQMLLLDIAKRVGVPTAMETLEMVKEPKRDPDQVQKGDDPGLDPEVEVEREPDIESTYFTRQMEKYVQMYGAKKVVGISDTNKYLIRSALDQATKKGWDIEKTQRRIRSYFRGEMSRARGLRIARTEVLGASSFANHQSGIYIQDNYGISLLKEWLPTPFGNFRPSHLAMQTKKPIPLEQPFRVGGEWMDAPHDPKAPPGEVINCRCSMAYRRQTSQTPPPPASSARIPDPVDVASSFIEFKPLKTRAEAKQFITNAVRKHSGQQAKKVDIPTTMEMASVNRRMKVLSDLMNDYKHGEGWSDLNFEFDISFRSTSKSYGYIAQRGYRNTIKWQKTQLRFGDKTDGAGVRVAGKRANKESYFPFNAKSQVDFDNLEVSTTVHEFAHYTTVEKLSGYSSQGVANTSRLFWDRLHEIRNDYYKTLRADRRAGDWDAINKYHLGNYADDSPDEFLAESFTEWRLNKTNPSPFAVRVGELFDEFFKR